MPTFPTTVFRFAWWLLRPHKISLCVFAAVALLWSFEASLSPYLLKLIIDGANQTGTKPSLLLPTILVPALLYCSMSVFMNLTFRCYGITCLYLFPKLQEKVITTVFSYLSKHSYRYFQEHLTGTLTAKMTALAEGIEMLIQIPNEFFIPRTIAVIVASFSLALVSPLFTILLLGWVMLFVVMTYFLARKVAPHTERFADSYTTLGGRITDSLSNIVTTKMFAREDYEYGRVNQVMDTVVGHARAMHWRLQLSHVTQGFFVTLLIAGFMSLLIHLRAQGLVTVGDFAFVLTLGLTIVQHIWDLGSQMVLFTKEVGKCKQALSLVTVPIEVEDKDGAQPLRVSAGAITFNQVCFSYVKGSETLKNISLEIAPGSKVGLVGFSGGGKSTFVKLILRLFDLDSGSILIDGQDIRLVTKNSLRRNVAMIPQDPELFHRSILDNIRYGNLDATEEEVIAVAKAAHCHEFIMNIPDAYQALVGEKGVKLSGGQKQRIAIARAILKGAPVLILDEATSALDSQTERYIQSSLENMMAGKTTIVIAHRLSTLHAMDRILFFKEGEIVEDGSLEALLAAGGYFAKLWQMGGDGYLPELSIESNAH